MTHNLRGEDPEELGWEGKVEMPIVCETCLGPNPYVRMQRIEYGGECHISGRPYTVFRWRPEGGRYKKTIICQDVAKAKNVCQVCLLDLDHGLPVQVRDAALGRAGEEGLPESEAGREFALNRMAADGELDDRRRFEAAGGAAGGGAVPELLAKLSRAGREPYYARNRAKLCTFFARGACNRGAECPYRHEMPDPAGNSHPMSRQNIRDRYYGVNDPVAAKMMARAAGMASLAPPEDKTVTTLFVGGAEGVTEDDLRGVFYPHGELRSVKVLPAKGCAFVTYAARDAAERAAAAVGMYFEVAGRRCKLLWGRPQPAREPGRGGGGGPGAPPATGAAAFAPAPPGAYAAADPTQAGTRAPGAEQPGGKRPSGDAARQDKRPRHDGQSE